MTSMIKFTNLRIQLSFKRNIHIHGGIQTLQLRQIQTVQHAFAHPVHVATDE